MAEISYIKTDWENGVTKLNATNMNHIENGIKAVTDGLETKVDKITEDKRVYRTYSASDTNYTTFSTGVNPYTFMVRDETANTYVSTPTHGSHCATKKYVDNKTNFDIVYSSSDIDASRVSRAKWIANLTTNNIIGYEYFNYNPLYYAGMEQKRVVAIDFVNETITYIMTMQDSEQCYSGHFSEFYLDSGMTQQLTSEWFYSSPYWSVNSISYIVYK